MQNILNMLNMQNMQNMDIQIKLTLGVCSWAADRHQRRFWGSIWARSSAEKMQCHDVSWNSTRTHISVVTRANNAWWKKHKYTKYARYAKYANCIPMFSSRSEKVESLCAIIKIWQGSIHTAHVTDCAVQHDIIVISRQSPCRISFVNLCQSALQSPCQIKLCHQMG